MSPSSGRDWRLYAEDIVTACGKVRRFVAGMAYEAVVTDERTQDAVMRNLEIIGEAAKNIPDEVFAGAPEIHWRNIRGMRDVLAHGYFGMSLPIVWATATTRIDEVEAAITKILSHP
ncbi:MAG TPA: DUF86 domain-containing protein [Candidatus Methylomirabilis sp.]|nr:DUF86 domain-containing protein [Candidatus Methylomirabilis sp.]